MTFRFVYLSGNVGSLKLCNSVEFPVDNLNMSEFIPECPPESYELYGAIHHFGSVHSGHYTAHVLSGSGWFNCNDSNISPLESPLSNSDSAYVLFYRKKNRHSSSQ